MWSKKEQILLTLDDTRSAAVLRESEAKVANLEAMAARLRAESYGTAIQFMQGLVRTCSVVNVPLMKPVVVQSMMLRIRFAAK